MPQSLIVVIVHLIHKDRMSTIEHCGINALFGIFVETDIKMSQDLAAILIQMLLKTIFQFLGIRHGGEVEIPAQSNVVELIAYLSGIVAGARVTHKSSVRLLKHLHFNISSSLDYLETTCLLDNV